MRQSSNPSATSHIPTKPPFRYWPRNECPSSLLLKLQLGVHGHDLDLIRMHTGRIVELEVDVLDYECPDLIAETVCVKVAL